MEISEIYAIIISAAPAITAVIGIIVALGVGIGNIKKANQTAVDTAKKAHKDTVDMIAEQNAKIVENVAKIAQKNEDLQRENEELKKDLRQMVAKLNHVHIIDNK